VFARDFNPPAPWEHIEKGYANNACLNQYNHSSRGLVLDFSVLFLLLLSALFARAQNSKKTRKRSSRKQRHPTPGRRSRASVPHGTYGFEDRTQDRLGSPWHRIINYFVIPLSVVIPLPNYTALSQYFFQYSHCIDALVII
jgi:hypothetical protein